MIKSLEIGAIGEIYNQIPLDRQISSECEYLNNGYFDTNACFWNYILEETTIRDCLISLSNNKKNIPIKVEWAVNNIDTYILLLNKAKRQIFEPSYSAQEIYAHLETLQIACDILYYAQTAPFRLNVATGFLRSSDSSQEMVEACLLPFCNPYLKFIKEHVIPMISSEAPQMLWLCGRPNIATFAIAMLTRAVLPNIHIGVIRHTSEYYSLNKIIPLLSNNHIFFSVFDCVVLYNDDETKAAVERHLSMGHPISDAPNLLFTLDRGKTISQSEYKKSENIIHKTIHPNSEFPVDVRLFPNNHCYWNRCSFCGINKKYSFNECSSKWDCTYAFNLLRELHKRKVKKFWVIDEALPVAILNTIAQYIIENNFDFEWHVRTRIEKELIDDTLCDKLYKSGLRNILLGFESGAERILKQMNKTQDASNYINTAEIIVKKYNQKGISVHFPAIIGFPTETNEERALTVDCLEYLHRIYPLFTYNINILELDVCSELYRRFEQFDIPLLLYPCKPSNFLGNTIQWRHNIDTLKSVQEQSMLTLFKWYPCESSLDIVTFYRLLEHNRLPFFGTSLYESCPKYSFRGEDIDIGVNKKCDCFITHSGNYVLFNSQTYKFVSGGEYLKTIYDQDGWFNYKEILEKFPLEFEADLDTLLQCLIDYNIILIRR